MSNQNNGGLYAYQTIEKCFIVLKDHRNHSDCSFPSFLPVSQVWQY